MDVNMNMAGNGMGMGGYYGQQMQDPYQNSNPYFMGQPIGFNPTMQAPNNQNALTNEEIQRLRSNRPSNSLNLTIEPEDVLRAMCTHKDNGRDVVQMVNDGSGDVWCPICGERWKPERLSNEEVQELVEKLISQMQNTKWVSDLPVNMEREYFSIMPLLRKYIDVHKYGMKNFDKYAGQNAYYSAADANIYSMYNGLFGSAAYGSQMYGNPYQQFQPSYYQQQMQAQAAVGGGQQANPAYNPMQQPQYGMPGYNPQFGNQANMMMGGTFYQQPPQGMQGMGQAMGQAQPGYNPVFGNTQQMGAQAQQTTGNADANAGSGADVKAEL